jgi:hypothetical protein
VSAGVFGIEEGDIARLAPSAADEIARTGWVNVGAYALRIEIDGAGDLSVQAYPCGEEDDGKILGELKARQPTVDGQS